MLIILFFCNFKLPRARNEDENDVTSLFKICDKRVESSLLNASTVSADFAVDYRRALLSKLYNRLQNCGKLAWILWINTVLYIVT